MAGEINWVQEAGYVAAMEVTFAGMSLLANQDRYYGHYGAGAFHLFMAIAGANNARFQEAPTHAAGYLLLSAGFLATSWYNAANIHGDDKRTRFLVNFLGTNALVFSGYALDAF